MLVLSRRSGQEIRILARPVFATKLAQLLQELGFITGSDVHRAETLLREEMRSSPLFRGLLHVVRTAGDRTRLGFEFPAEWAIVRGELADTEWAEPVEGSAEPPEDTRVEVPAV